MTNRVREPAESTEFEVQATLFCELRRLGINVRGEMIAQLGIRRGRRAVARFDLAIFELGELAGIIEVKARAPRWSNAIPWTKTRQGSRYLAFAVPVAVVHGMSEAWAMIARVEELGRMDWSRWGGSQS